MEQSACFELRIGPRFGKRFLTGRPVVYLTFAQAQRLGQFFPFLRAQVFMGVELVLQGVRLFISESTKTKIKSCLLKKDLIWPPFLLCGAFCM